MKGSNELPHLHLYTRVIYLLRWKKLHSDASHLNLWWYVLRLPANERSSSYGSWSQCVWLELHPRISITMRCKSGYFWTNIGVCWSNLVYRSNRSNAERLEFIRFVSVQLIIRRKWCQFIAIEIEFFACHRVMIGQQLGACIQLFRQFGLAKWQWNTSCRFCQDRWPFVCRVAKIPRLLWCCRRKPNPPRIQPNVRRWIVSATFVFDLSVNCGVLLIIWLNTIAFFVRPYNC